VDAEIRKITGRCRPVENGVPDTICLVRHARVLTGDLGWSCSLYFS
jgi:hypothetical protein